LQANSAIIADRFYNDFLPLNNWASNKVKFVIRHKYNLKFNVIKENELPDNRQENILKDEVIELKIDISKSNMMLRVMKKMAKYGWHMSNLVAFLRLNIFVKINLQKWLDLHYQESQPPPKEDAQGAVLENTPYL